MPSDKIVQMDRELATRLRMAGTVADRERLVIENLRRKEAFISGAPFPNPKTEAERMANLRSAIFDEQ